MRKRFRGWFVLWMAGLLGFTASSSHAVAYRPDKIPIDDALKKSYSELFELAEQRQFSEAEVDSARDAIKRGKELCVSRFRQKSSQYQKEIDQAQKQLKDSARQVTESQRHELHCKIQNLRALQSQTEILTKHA